MKTTPSNAWNSFTPLERALKKDRNEIEAIALDWMYQIIIHELQKRPLLIMNPVNNQIMGKLFGNTSAFFAYAILHRHSNADSIRNKPASIEHLRTALCDITALSHQDLLRESLTRLQKIIDFASAGYSICFETSAGRYVRITDTRLPFQSMQPDIER